MLKHICDSCGKEFDGRFEFVQIEYRYRRDFLLELKGGKKGIKPEIFVEHYHLCPDCWHKIRKEFTIQNQK